MDVDDLIRTMDSFVGQTEHPPGSNCCDQVREFGYPSCAPWCAMTVSNACARNGFPLHEAAVIQIVNRAKQGWLGMSWSTVPVRGSAVCFDWKGHGNPNDMHTGLVYEVLGDGQYRTIEGNYRDRCDRWLRDMKYVNGFAVFPFDEAPIPIPPPQQETDDMAVRIMRPNDDVPVFIVDADLQGRVQVPDANWLADAAFRLGGRVLSPPAGTATEVNNGVTIEVVSADFLRPIPIRH